MTTAVLWVPPNAPAPKAETQILWSQFHSSTREDNLVISLPELVESNSDYWRRRYLTWLDSIGSGDYNGETVNESLRIRPGLSYWWMTVPSEFLLDPDSFAYAVIRLWAFDEVAVRPGLKRLEVEGASWAMRQTLSRWSLAKSIVNRPAFNGDSVYVISANSFDRLAPA